MVDNQAASLLLHPGDKDIQGLLDNRPVHRLFEKQAGSTPERVAAIHEREQLTYRELNDYADRLSCELERRGVAAGHFVPIVMPKGLNMLIAMLAIMKSGAAYVPVDPDWPSARLRYVLDDVDGPCILTMNTCVAAVAQSHSDSVFVVDYAALPSAAAVNTKRPVESAAASSLEAPIYAIYTSGSTGKPKGAIIPQRGIVNRFRWMTEVLGPDTAHTTLQLSNPTFDSSVWQFIWPLLHGGKTVIPDSTMENSPSNLLLLAYTHKVTLIHFVPSMLDLVTELAHMDRSVREYLDTVRFVWVGGEKLSPRTAEAFRVLFPHILLSNHYGPTETSIACLYYPIHELPPGDVPIGRPIANVKVVLLDEERRLVNDGAPGEIYIGGSGVGLGYLHDPEKTNASFFQIPGLGDEFWYKSGDLGRLLPDQSFAYLGRKDFQVKIRGYRVELGEIEAVLGAHPSVRQAVVLARRDALGDAVLVAYYRSEQPIEASELRRCLAHELPDYMIPLHFNHLPKMPLLSNGKLNVQELLAMPLASTDQTMNIATSETERTVAAIWESLLGVSAIDENSHFFELGGQSLKAIRCAMLVNQTFGVKLKVADVFTYPTLGGLAAYIEGQQKDGKGCPPIPDAGTRPDYPVTSAQKRLYIMDRARGPQTSYNIPGFILIEGQVDVERLERALGQLVNRHASLRTSFGWNGIEPVQIVYTDVAIGVERIELSGGSPEEAAERFVRPFNLERPPLLRAGIAMLEDGTSLFMFDVHHIVADAISVSILLQEWFALYHGEPFGDPHIQYTDYAVWEQENEARWLEDESYWLEQFAGLEAAAAMPLDFPRPQEPHDGSGRIKRYLTPEQNERLEQWCSQNGATKYMVLLAVFSILQMQYTNQEDIVVGAPMAGRDHPELESMIGMFVQTLAIRTFPSNQLTFRDYLMNVKQQVLEALDRQHYPFERLIERLKVRREPGRNPLFDTMLVLQNMDLREAMLVSQGMHLTEQKLGDWTLRPFSYEHRAAKFDLLLEAVERNGALGLKFDYSAALFRPETIELFSESFLGLLDRFLSAPDARIGEVSCVTASQRRILLENFNNTGAKYPAHQTLDRLFDEQASRYPSRIAVRAGAETLTYRELHERASSIACTLRMNGARPNEVIGIMTERSVEMLAGILGILQAGAAYMPLDPAYPAARIAYMLQHSGASKVLVQREHRNKLPVDRERLVVQLEEIPKVTDLPELSAPEHTAGDLAYVIYTSGTTGKPKGVMIEHHSVMNRINWMQKRFPLGAQDVILQKTTFTFDVSVWELFWWMFAGASISLLAPGAEKEPKQISQTIREHRITVIHFVPSMLSLFLEYLERVGADSDLFSLRFLFVSGEALPRRLADRFHDLSGIQAKLVNVYGPTEATVDVTCYICEPNGERGPVPIGQPIDNHQIYILNDRLEPVPAGVPGDLWIAGVGLARGYLNDPELTADKFVTSPFAPERRMYRSGDIARWLANGHIEYVGRSDHQIKIRGYRIEADELVHHALSFPAVKEAAIRTWGEQEDKKLCLYIVADRSTPVLDLKSYLLTMVPSYMVPDFIVSLERLPLTHNGKADVNRLPEPGPSVQASVEVENAVPGNSVEADVLRVWKSLLNLDSIGVDDDFFQLGGNSLLAIRLELEMESLGYPVDNIGVFRHKTIRALARHLQTLQVNT